MINPKKRIVSAVIIAIIAIALAIFAYLMPYNDDSISSKQDTEQKTIEIWTFFDMNTPDDYYVDYWQELAQKYNININVKTYSTQQIKDKLKIAAAGRQLPDIYLVWGGTYPDYLFDASLATPIQGYLSDCDVHFLDSYTKPYTDGNNYIIPCLPEAYGVTYANTALLDKLGLSMPTTWEELLKFVDDVNTYNQQHGTDYAAIELGNKDAWLGELLYYTIANSLNPQDYTDLLQGNASITDETFSKAASYIKELEKAGAFGDDFMEIGETEAVADFIEGNALLFPHQSTIVYYLMSNMGEDNLSVSSFPACSSDATGHILDINHTLRPGLCISSTCDDADLAASLCLDFALQVNESNVTQYGYFNMTSEDYQLPDALPEPVASMRELVYGADQISAYLYAILPSDNANSLRSLTRNLYAGSYDTNTFLQKASAFLE
ncbi:ABC transporter substrate-binding protein [Eubacterium oxidoreducens]|uniref:Raffinose/stachyose/melibiose transport system substrate-binding protein n=1 Tax=Eubacterium oxidoreducens TaxID=1732 RepID=A0A1G6AE73_EUBOX|nr:extracellular solute-binding protein [Eubacterium oxidoreducens]SDB06610.1 raffinose/stachyose/melibiose transport system substrate-binding protein [Eubacterium oxidoreducens]